MNLTGKEFEAAILERAGHLEDEKILTLRRYGVQAVYMLKDGKMQWQIMKSFPDFDGAIAPQGRELIIEAKACSEPSYPIGSSDKKNPKQIAHMLERSRFGSLCFLMIHFNERLLKTRTDDQLTVALRVADDEVIWREYDRFQRRTISREDAISYGIVIPWNVWSPRASKLTPDLRVLINAVPQPELQLT